MSKGRSGLKSYDNPILGPSRLITGNTHFDRLARKSYFLFLFKNHFYNLYNVNAVNSMISFLKKKKINKNIPYNNN